MLPTFLGSWPHITLTSASTITSSFLSLTIQPPLLRTASSQPPPFFVQVTPTALSPCPVHSPYSSRSDHVTHLFRTLWWVSISLRIKPNFLPRAGKTLYGLHHLSLQSQLIPVSLLFSSHTSSSFRPLNLSSSFPTSKSLY